MINGITLAVVIIVSLLLTGFSLSLLINMFLAPLLKTPNYVLEEIVKEMNLQEDTYLADLGCGDGRLLFKAHLLSKCKCTGYDIAPIMIIAAEIRRILQFPLNRDITFDTQDIFTAQLDKFNKIYCYLDSNTMKILTPKLKEFIQDGGDIYSYRYEIDGMQGRKKMLKDGKPLFLYEYNKN